MVDDILQNKIKQFYNKENKPFYECVSLASYLKYVLGFDDEVNIVLNSLYFFETQGVGDITISYTFLGEYILSYVIMKDGLKQVDIDYIKHLIKNHDNKDLKKFEKNIKVFKVQIDNINLYNFLSTKIKDSGYYTTNAEISDVGVYFDLNYYVAPKFDYDETLNTLMNQNINHRINNDFNVENLPTMADRLRNCYVDTYLPSNMRVELPDIPMFQHYLNINNG